MLREILRRDLVVHRRALMGTAITLILVLGAWSLGTCDTPSWTGDATGILVLGLILAAVMPASMQIQEMLHGTLGDLVALPVHRRDIVRARFVEGLAACVGFLLLFILAVALKAHPSAAVMGQIVVSPVVPWPAVLVMAYIIPVTQRSSLAWMGWAMVLPLVGVPVLLLLTRLAGPAFLLHLAGQFLQLVATVHAHAAGALLIDLVLPLAVLGLSYGISNMIFDKVDL